MTDSATLSADDAFVPGDHVQELSFLATDEELLLLLQDHRGALMKLYPEGADELSRGVANAVKRSLVARRAVILDEEGARLELLQPWAGLVETLTAGDRFCRLTFDGDDRSARLVLVGEDALFTIDRDPTGVNTVTISVPEFAARVATELLVGDGIRDDDELVAPVDFATHRLTADALAEGRQALEQGDDVRGERLLGPTTEFFRRATRTVRVETMQLTGGVVHGSEFDVLDAGSGGWARVVFAGDDTPDVIVTPLSDDELSAAMARALAS
ncbi:MAG: hypothetical protein Q7T71_18040 [Herbiconiux sp.]|nr:hypothetical protein [Herbiconiux sp.]